MAKSKKSVRKLWYCKNILYITIAFTLFLSINAGCFDKGTSVNVEPEICEFQRTININDYLSMAGEFCDGNPGAQSTPYDLNFYYASYATDSIGLRGGYFDAKGVKSYLKICDLGAVEYENIDKLPAIEAYDSVYKNIKSAVSYAAVTDSVALVRMNHVYSVYKWSAYGGNYLKLFIDYIDPINKNVTIKGVYQKRQGYNLLY